MTSQAKIARARLTAFVSRISGATLHEANTMIVNDHLVLGGSPADCERVRAHFAGALGVSGVVVDVPYADDPEFTCVRIPDAGVRAARERLEQNL